MARRNQHSLAEIKTMVLEAAEAIIIEEGFAALTIRKIAMEMGYTVGSIYMVFSNRADLIRHINARTLAEIANHLQPISTTGDIEAWIKAYLQYIRTNTQRWQMIYTPCSLEDQPLPDWYQAHLETVFQQFTAYFPHTPKQNQQAVQALWLGIHGIALLSSNDDLEAAVLALLNTFLRGWNS